MKWFISLAITMGLAFVSIGLVFIIYIGVVKTVEIHNWEKKADNTISTIDGKVKDSLTKIEQKGEATIKAISKKAKYYLDLTYYWHSASKALEEGDLITAKKCYKAINQRSETEKSMESDYKDETIASNVFQVTVASTSARIPSGSLDFKLAKIEQDEQEKKQLLTSAKENLEMGMKKGEGYAHYELAGIYAYENNEYECRKQLKEGEQKGVLPARKCAETDSDFANMHDKKWFKEIQWAGE